MIAYNLNFVFNECGFDWLPREIDRARLFNVAYDLDDRSIKLYVFDESRRFVHKIDQNRTITRQYRGDEVDPAPVWAFLGDSFDQNDVLVDAVEDQTYYALIEKSSAREYNKFLNRFCLKFAISKSQLIDAVNRINRRPVQNLLECCTHRAISMVKVPLSGAQPKIYARPFLTGSGFDLPDHAATFLGRVFDCETTRLPQQLRCSWVASELSTNRITIATQPCDDTRVGGVKTVGGP